MTTHSDQGSPRRKIGFHHLAFLRGTIQQPDPKKWWNAYLFVNGPFDARAARATLTWLRDELIAAAHRAQRPRVAALLKRDPAQLPQVDVPALDQFASAYPADFYSEAELQGLFAEKFGKVGALAARRQRLMQRQLEALNWLEPLVATEPQAQDRVEGWFEPKVSARLRAAGVATVGDLVQRINGLGVRWWSAIKGIGAQGGARVQRWVAENEDAIGMRLGPQATIRRRALDTTALMARLPRITAIVPLERFMVPAELDGSNGRFRAQPQLCMLEAHNDYEAIMAWLASKGSRHTARAYRKEAERFLLWSIVQRERPLSSMTLEDCSAYRDFLADPKPHEKWCGPRSRERWGPLWRPFEGPLSPASQKQAIDILRSLFDWLMRQRYLVGNPWAGVSARKISTPRLDISRSFTAKQWAFLEGQLEQLPATGSARRLKFVLSFAYGTGLRLSELVNAKVRDLDLVEFDAHAEGWVLKVVGKGSKLREVPIPDGLIAEVGQYLVCRGLNPDPREAAEETYLIGKIDDAGEGRHLRAAYDPKDGISASTLYDQLKRFFVECSGALEISDKKGAARIAQASTHWLRHTFGSHAVAAHTPLEVVQSVLGHASLNTTTIYVKAERKRRFQEMQRFWDEQMVARDRRRAGVE